jgi:hypothetical protein
MVVGLVLRVGKVVHPCREKSIAIASLRVMEHALEICIQCRVSDGVLKRLSLRS